MDAIYLDRSATTPVDPQVLEAMLPYLRGEFGSRSSAYALGRRAQAAVGQAPAAVADSEEPAAILSALGLSREAALGAVPLSLGRSTTRADIERAAFKLACAWRRVRGPPEATR